MKNKYDLGNEISWGNHTWIIVGIDDNRIYCGLNRVLFSSPFGRDNVYRHSALSMFCEDFEIAIQCEDFEHSPPASVLDEALDTTVFGVTRKIFIPTIQMIGVAFQYFKDPNHLKCVNVIDKPVVWWTASPNNSGDAEFVYCVDTYGEMFDYDPGNTFGLRPFVALDRSRLH